MSNEREWTRQARLYYIASSAHLKQGLNAVGEEGYTLLYHVLKTCIPLYQFKNTPCVRCNTKLATQPSSRVLSEPC